MSGQPVRHKLIRTLDALMNKHTYITPNLTIDRTPSGFAPRHRANYITVDGIDYLTDDTLVQCVDEFGQDLDVAVIIGMCGCGCGEYDIAPVGWETDPEWSVANNAGLAVRVEDQGIDTAEGVPMVKFLGIFRRR